MASTRISCGGLQGVGLSLMCTTITSYNCQQSGERAVNHITLNAGADAICIQEGGARVHGKVATGVALNTVSSTATSMDDGCSVVTHTKERPGGSHEIPIGAGKNANRPAVAVRLRGGIWVINVHLTSGRSSTTRQQAELHEIIRVVMTELPGGERFVIIGDFNFDPRDIAAEFGLHALPGPRHESGANLDWAIGNIDFDLKELPRYSGSDHGPFQITIPCK